MKIHRERGIALILVTFIVALASIIVVSVVQSTYLGSRMNAVVERSLTAEYLLKSTLNVAIALLQTDPDYQTDGFKDIWAKFADGLPIPPNLLGITDPSIRVALEIAPENRKLKFINLVNSSGIPDVRYRDMLVTLFRQPNLDFDNDKQVMKAGPLKGQFFDAEQTVAALIDYQDPDDVSYTATGFAQGIEANVKKGVFANKLIDRIPELYSVPGFTPTRIRKLSQFITIYDGGAININFADPELIYSLSPQIGPQEFAQIKGYRESDQGPFTASDGKMRAIIGDTLYNQIKPQFDYASKWFQIVGEVDYGPKAYFMRAIVYRQTPGTPLNISSLEFF